MPWNPLTGQFSLDQFNGTNQPTPRTPGYNDPNYDPQRFGQLGYDPRALNGFQPTPAGPPPQTYTGGTNFQNVFGSSPYANQGGATTMPVGNPDILGNSGTDYQNIYQPLAPVSFGQDNSGGGTTLPYGSPADKFGAITPVPVGTPNPAMSGGGGAVNPDAAYPKFDPAFLSQIQAALEAPNGPYAGRQVGDYAPPDAPPNVQNPQTESDWKDRFYWFAAHPEALANPSAPRNMQTGLPPGVVPFQQFTPDVYSDVNANRNFAELSGVVDAQRQQVAQQQYGWQFDQGSYNSRDDGLAQATQMKQTHPEYSYDVYQKPDGTFGIAARELDQASQQKRGFFAPGMAPKPAGSSFGGGGGSSYRAPARTYTSGGGGGGYATSKPPATSTPVQSGPTLDTRMTGGQVNMAQPVEGQIVTYNGQLVQFRQGQWVPFTADTRYQHVSPV